MINLTVNGRTLEASVPPDEPLLWVLRDDLGLTGTKPGCGVGACGLCTVLIDGRPAHSCRTPARDTAGRSIRTVEGLAARDAEGREVLHPVQQAFLELQVPQCGWCTPGQLVTAASFLDEHPDPSDADPLDFRLAHLDTGNVGRRLRLVLEAAAKRSGWEKPAPTGRARGVACCAYGDIAPDAGRDARRGRRLSRRRPPASRSERDPRRPCRRRGSRRRLRPDGAAPARAFPAIARMRPTTTNKDGGQLNTITRGLGTKHGAE